MSARAGMKVDGARVRFWATKRAAVAGAKSIGWRAGDVTPIHTRFCIGWAIADPGDLGPCPFLSRERFAELFHARKS